MEVPEVPSTNDALLVLLEVPRDRAGVLMQSRWVGPRVPQDSSPGALRRCLDLPGVISGGLAHARQGPGGARARSPPSPGNAYGAVFYYVDTCSEYGDDVGQTRLRLGASRGEGAMVPCVMRAPSCLVR